MFNGLSIERGLLAAAVTVIVLLILQPVARKLNLLDHPVGRKDHAHPTPVTGGLAVAIGIATTQTFSLAAFDRELWSFFAASGLLIVTGIADDKYDLRWYWRIGIQVVAALIMIYGGHVRVEQLGPAFGIEQFSLGIVAVPFTVFATVGLINAINMIDGADGLSGLLVTAALAMIGAAALYAGNTVIAERQLILIGAMLAFLLFNMRFRWQPKAKVFLGNAGSAFLGFVIAWQVFRLSQNPGHPVSPALALWFLPVPVMDTLVLMLRRMRVGKSPFAADRNHIHHLMMEAGFGPTQTGLVLAGFSLLCGLIAAQAMRLDVPTPLLLVAFGLLCAAWFWLTCVRDRAIGFFRALYNTGLLGHRRMPAPTVPSE